MSFILEPDVPFLIADDKVFEHYLHAQTDQYLCLELKSLEHALIAMDDFDVLTNHLSDMFLLLENYRSAICEELAERCCKSVLSALPAPDTE